MAFGIEVHAGGSSGQDGDDAAVVGVSGKSRRGFALVAVVKLR